MTRRLAGPAPSTSGSSRSGSSRGVAPRGVFAAVMALFALVASTWVAPAASAHNWLTSSNPAAGSTITSAPASVQLTFNDRVLTQPSPARVVVTGPDGKHYETACARTTDRQVDVAWKPGSPGTYRVEYRIVSADGHPVSNTLTFTYRGASGGNAGRDEALSCGSGSEAQAGSSGSGGSATPGSGSTSSGSSTSGGSSAPVIVAVVTAVLAAGAIITMILRSRRGGAVSTPARRHDDDDEIDDDEDGDAHDPRA